MTLITETQRSYGLKLTTPRDPLEKIELEKLSQFDPSLNPNWESLVG